MDKTNMSAEQIQTTHSNRERVAAGLSALLLATPYTLFLTGNDRRDETLAVGPAKEVAMEAVDRFMDQTVGDKNNRRKLLKLSVGQKSRQQIDRQFEVAPPYSGGHFVDNPVEIEHIDNNAIQLRVRAVKSFDDSPAQPPEASLPYTYDVSVRKTNDGMRVESIEEYEGWAEPSPTPAP